METLTESMNSWYSTQRTYNRRKPRPDIENKDNIISMRKGTYTFPVTPNKELQVQEKEKD